MRAYTHRFISFAIQCAVMILLALGLSFSTGRSLAQDTPTETPVPTATATVAPTDIPTELPTVVPTDIPTEQPTDAPTQAVTDVPTEASTEQPTAATTDIPTDIPTDLPTGAPTEAVTQAPATPDTPNIFTEDFQDGETTGWLLTSGWTLADEAGNAVLTASTPNEIATLTAVTWPYFTLSFRVRGTIQLTMSSGGSNYQVTVAADGAASLTKDGVLVGQSAGAVPTDATVEPDANWHTVSLLAPGNILAVKVDNFAPISTADPTLAGMGPIMFSTTADNSTGTAFDDLSIQHLDAPPPVPTAVPTLSGVVPIPPPMNVTVEPTVEVTAEATVESTQEATAEATVEVTQEATAEATVEATTEATAEATAEATIEATAEATVEPPALSEAGRAKLPPALADILDAYLAGDMAGAQAAAADYFITVDNQQRISLTIWTADEPSAAKISGEITAAGGIITDAFSIRLQASVTLDGLLALANAPEVTLLEVPPKAVSTSDMQAAAPSGFGSGSEISEGVDTTGAAAWQNAGIKGAGVGIAVIDTGFGASSTTTAPVSAVGDYACLNNSTVLGQLPTLSDSSHGLLMAQVLCDVAPSAKVYMYKAVDATTLKDAVVAATGNASVKVIVIAMDLGASISPGDGTNGGNLYGVTNLYTSLTNARNAGKIVIASAGNNHGRYVALDYTTVTTTVPMTVFGGDIIHASWSDWSGVTQDVTLSISGDITAANYHVSAAPNRVGAPRAVYTVTAGTCAAGCNITLTISGTTSGVVLQLQVAGQGTINKAGISGASPTALAGEIARPADSPDVIAVGAVCNDANLSLNLDSFSSYGPAYGAGGIANPNAGAVQTRDTVKPDLSGPSHVSTLSNRADGFNCNDSAGFNGTSASAAHIAGMVALLVSNTNSSMSAFDSTTTAAFNGVRDYLETHTIDNPSSAVYGVGFDTAYGAGFSVLGSPTYDLSQIVTPANPANQLPVGCTTVLYAGLTNPGTIPDGSLAKPYMSINDAINSANTVNKCVVVLPGEYVGQINTYSATTTPLVISYNSATSFAASPSNLWSVFLPPIFLDASSTMVDGFTIQSAFTLTYASGSGGTTIHTPAFRLRNPVNGGIQNSTFTGYKLPGTITSSVTTATNVQILNNTFSNFVISSSVSGPIVSSESDSAVIKVSGTGSNVSNGAVTGLVTIKGNTFKNNTITATNGTISTWQSSVIGIRFSRADIFNNRFESNSTGALIGVDQWQGSPSTSTNVIGEIRIFGNLFNANLIYGPLIHLFASPNTRFVNNTVINNSMFGHIDGNGDSQPDSDVRYDGYLIYGTIATTNAADISNASGGRQVEIHNNLFYNNGVPRRGVMDNANASLNISCLPINSGAPVRNNWFSPVIGLDNTTTTVAGECDAVGKITGSIDEPLSSASFFGSVIDPIDPYRLRPTDPNTTTLKSGINTGDNQALIDMFGDPAYLSQLDLRGGGRVIIGGNPNPTYTSALNVDIGAYELDTPSAPVANPVTKTIAEDSATSVVFTLAATGGYTQVFSITSQPSEYDTNTANACGGQPLLFTAPKTVTYCPPANFHTQYGSGNSNVPVTIGFSVEDPIFKPGQISNNNITLTITAVDDGPAVAPNLTVLSDYFTPINQQLLPSYQLSPFILNSTGGSVDYPFTYSYVSQTGTDNANLLQSSPTDPTTVQVLQAALTAASTNGGKLILNPVAGQQGYFSFTYRVTDQDGNQATGNATIVILPTLAKEGIYDDASFNFVYNGAGWAPSFVTGAYNNTLHATSTSSESVEFPFTGSTVRFNMRGSTNASSTIKLAFKTNIGGGGVTYQDYATTKGSISSLVCTDSLNNSNPNGSSDVTNYSSTGAAYTIICSGFPTGQVHSIRLTNNLVAAMTLDSAEVSAGVMTAGKSYQETSANITYVNGWSLTTNASMLGGGWAYTNVNDATFTFNIDSTVGRIVFYRATYAASANLYGSMDVFIDGNPTRIANINNSNTSTGYLFGQPYLLTIASPGNHTITVKNVGAKYGDIDQITTLPVAQTLGVGDYQESYPDLTYAGIWTTAANASMFSGAWSYTNDPNATVSFKIDSSVSRIVVYRPTYLAGVYGPMNVYLDGNLTTPIAVINTNSSTFLYKQPFLITIPTQGYHTVTIKNVGSTYSGIDQISLLGATQRLGVGDYQENNVNLTYSGIWSSAANASMFGGAWTYTTDPNASVSFKIDSTVSRVVVYRFTYLAGVYGSMKVYLDSDLVTPVATIDNFNTAGATLYKQPFLISIPVTGNHTITIKNVGSTYSNIDQISLLGDTDYLAPGTYQENDINVTYSSGWTPQSLVTAIGGSRSYTNQDKASVSFKINNTVSRVVIYRTTLTGVYGSMKVYLDTDLNNPIATINHTSATLLSDQPAVINIGTLGNHTITLVNVGSTYSDLDQITLLTSSTRLSAGTTGNTYQETFPDITYTGSWAFQAVSTALGGSRKYTNTNNDTVSFDIDNTVSRVIVYRTTYPGSVYGPMEVRIDGALAPESPINNSNTTSGYLWGQPFTINIASPGNHTVTLKNLGAGYTDLDQITLLPAPVALQANNTYQDTDPNLVYSDAWTTQATSSALGGTRTYTNTNNATVQFKIDSSVGRVVIYRTTYPGSVYGPMEVRIDGVLAPESPINNSNATTGYLWGQPFTLTIGTPGNYTITLKNLGAGYTDVDQIKLLPPASALPIGTYQETDPNFTYSGAWVTQAHASMLQNGWAYTTQNDASVKFDVDSTVARLVIYRTSYVSGVYGTMNVFIDTNPTPIATISNVSAAIMYGQPFLVTLPAGTPSTHTITIKNVGTTYGNIDQIKLLGPTVPLVPGTYQEDDLNLTYTGTWTPAANTAMFGNGWTYTTQNDAAVKFDIDSSVTRMVIYRTSYLSGVYGTMNVFRDSNPTPIATISNVNAALLYRQPFYVDIPSGTQTITIKNVGGTYGNIDQITLFAASTPMSTAGFYEESDQAFNFTGVWTRVQGSGPSGGAAYYTYAQNASITFKVTGTAFSIYRVLGPGAGTFSISVDGSPQSYPNSYTSTLWQQPIEFSGLTNTTHDVVITKTLSSADYIYFDAVRVIDPTATLTAGQYQNTYAGLHFNGNWSVSGASTVTSTPTNTLTFKFTGNGFGFITLNPNTNGTMTVSCIISGGSNVCANPSSTPVNGGYAFYNLKQGTYDVTITYTGSGGLYIDRVFVLDTPTTVLQPGTYEDTDPGIVYSPSDLWTTLSASVYTNGTTHFTAQKGAVMQVRFNGNSITLYGLAYVSGASNINLCVFLTDAAGNPTSVCSNYSQNTSATLFTAPVAFYGFGNGTHEIVVENRTQGLQFAVDKILVN
ncbi:MAG: hypothetical protein GC179_12475 [Anaerolineaceae bacterium]|nr:hypothetical protein [Anaerolineaceae bacterium]